MTTNDTRTTSSSRRRSLLAIVLFGVVLLGLALVWRGAAPTCAIVFVATVFAYLAPSRHEPRDPGAAP